MIIDVVLLYQLYPLYSSSIHPIAIYVNNPAISIPVLLVAAPVRPSGRRAVRERAQTLLRPVWNAPQLRVAEPS